MCKVEYINYTAYTLPRQKLGIFISSPEKERDIQLLK